MKRPGTRASLDLPYSPSAFSPPGERMIARSICLQSSFRLLLGILAVFQYEFFGLARHGSGHLTPRSLDLAPEGQSPYEISTASHTPEVAVAFVLPCPL